MPSPADGAPPNGDKVVVLGRVSGVFGVRGWIKVHSFTSPREALLEYSGWLLKEGSHWRPVDVAEARPHGKALVARLQDVDDRDRAATLVGSEIGVPRQSLPDTDDGQYYWSDLEGLRVETVGGEYLGRVGYLLETGAHDVLVVEDQGRERLIPFVAGQVVRQVDLDEGVIRVDWEWD